jgi:hypothetical protein
MMDVILQTGGMVQGGWGYVVAAYAATWIALLGYAASLWIRGREHG